MIEQTKCVACGRRFGEMEDAPVQCDDCDNLFCPDCYCPNCSDDEDNDEY